MNDDALTQPSSEARAGDAAVPAPVDSGSAKKNRPPAWRRYEWFSMTPFLLVHLGVFAAFWTGVTWQAVVCGLALLWIRMFAITAGYHRYFAHRTFKTSRWMQFIFAFVAQTSAQKGVLWWAAHHRVHHRYADDPEDVHSPVQDGFWYSHVLWIYDHTDQTRWERIQDFAKYPELRFLNRFWLLPPVLLGAAVYLALGWSGLVIGFFASTVALWHSTFVINSLAHVIGKRRWNTKDDSRNNWFLGLLTFGEGWHNNHHRYPSAARQGFYWWEIDVTYYVLKAMSWVGLVRDMREPPERMLAQGRENDRAAREGRAPTQIEKKRRGPDDATADGEAAAEPVAPAV